MVGRSLLAALLLLAAAVSLPAAVLDIQNFERNGQPVLVPRPHAYKALEGVCKLPRDFTVFVPRGEELIVEQLKGEARRFDLAVLPKGKGAFCRFIVTAKGVPAKGEGYVLTVSAKGITVVSRTAAGLFYGAQTLRNLLRNAATPELKCCRITDWPDFDLRGCSLHLRGIPVSKMPYIKQTLDALAAMRINRVGIGLGEAFPYKNNQNPSL